MDDALFSSAEHAAEQTPARRFSRRTVVKGVGWSVPVIAASLAVPRAAASDTACPSLPSSGWAAQIPAEGELWDNDPLPTGWDKPGWAGYFLSGQNVGNNPPGYAIVTTTASLAVQAGVTYTFSIPFKAEKAPGTTFRQQVDLLVNGISIFAGTTQADGVRVDLTDGSPAGVWVTSVQSATYTATATGIVPVEFSFDLRGGGVDINTDDIAVAVPSVRCS